MPKSPVARQALEHLPEVTLDTMRSFRENERGALAQDQKHVLNRQLREAFKEEQPELFKMMDNRGSARAGALMWSLLKAQAIRDQAEIAVRKSYDKPPPSTFEDAEDFHPRMICANCTAGWHHTGAAVERCRQERKAYLGDRTP